MRLKGSTASKIALAHAEASGVVSPFARVHDLKPCCIRGCDHRFRDECSELVPGPVVVYDRRRVGPVPDPYVGVACRCCADRLLHGDTSKAPTRKG